MTASKTALACFLTAPASLEAARARPVAARARLEAARARPVPARARLVPARARLVAAGALFLPSGARTRVLQAVLALPLLATPALAMPPGLAASQDTTTVVRIRGVLVEVPRPATTTGGTSAIEISLDSLAIAAPTAEELLRGIPMLQIRANSRGEAQPDLRGAEDRQIAILLDGIPITLGWDHRTDVSIIPITAVRKFRMLRGLSSMLHGPNVLGGALEFDIGRGSAAAEPPPPVTGAFSLDQEGATTVGATGAASFLADESEWVLRAGGGFRNSPGLALPGGARDHPGLREEFLAGAEGLRLNSDRRLVDGFLAARYLGSGGTWLSGLVSASDANRGVPPEAHVADPRLWRYPEQARLFIALSGGTERRPNRWGESRFEANFGLDRSTTEIDEYETASYQRVVDGETGTTNTFTGRFLLDHLIRDAVDLRGAFTIADVTHTETFASGNTFDYEQRLWSLGGEIEVASQGILGLGGGDTRWTLGGSLDGSDTPRSGDKEPVGTLGDWGMRAGLTRPAAGGRMLYHAGISRRTRFPSLRELYSGALGRFRPNPDLKPESLITAEAGVTIDTGDGLSLQVVGFHHRLGDAIVRTSTVTLLGPQFQRVNRDEVRSTGLEVAAAGTLGALAYGGGVTWKDVRVHDPHEPGSEQKAEYQPNLSGSANLGFVAPGAIAVTGFGTYRGVQYCRNVEIAGLDRMGASATFDVEASRVFVMREARSGRVASATVGVANLTDATVLDQCGLPQAGRTFRIQFTIR